MSFDEDAFGETSSVASAEDPQAIEDLRAVDSYAANPRVIEGLARFRDFVAGTLRQQGRYDPNHPHLQVFYRHGVPRDL
eukprot:5142735-Prorocentrum_lima.AAC.1